jgi:hypothetical protein
MTRGAELRSWGATKDARDQLGAIRHGVEDEQLRHVVFHAYGKTTSVWSADWTMRHQSPSAGNWNGVLPKVVSIGEDVLD